MTSHKYFYFYRKSPNCNLYNQKQNNHTLHRDIDMPHKNLENYFHKNHQDKQFDKYSQVKTIHQRKIDTGLMICKQDMERYRECSCSLPNLGSKVKDMIVCKSLIAESNNSLMNIDSDICCFREGKAIDTACTNMQKDIIRIDLPNINTVQSITPPLRFILDHQQKGLNVDLHLKC